MRRNERRPWRRRSVMRSATTARKVAGRTPTAGCLPANLVCMDGVGPEREMGSVLLDGAARDCHGSRLFEAVHEVGHLDLFEEHWSSSRADNFSMVCRVGEKPWPTPSPHRWWSAHQPRPTPRNPAGAETRPTRRIEGIVPRHKGCRKGPRASTPIERQVASTAAARSAAPFRKGW